ncbi:hypothetical protein V8C86DRAFT_2817607 [Haematococcus lacustris]
MCVVPSLVVLVVVEGGGTGRQVSVGRKSFLKGHLHVHDSLPALFMLLPPALHMLGSVQPAVLVPACLARQQLVQRSQESSLGAPVATSPLPLLWPCGSISLAKQCVSLLLWGSPKPAASCEVEQ